MDPKVVLNQILSFELFICFQDQMNNSVKQIDLGGDESMSTDITVQALQNLNLNF